MAILTPNEIEFHAYGGAALVQVAEDQEVLTDGPAGTGKTRNILEKINRLMSEYPGAKAVICRKTRSSMTQTVLETFNRYVLPSNSFKVIWRATEQEYRYPNGSKVVVHGLDDVEKTKSLEADIIFVNEATELEEADWETLLRALRNGVLPFQQLIADTNPGAPNHWLKKRCDRGQTRRIISRYTDNPAMWKRLRKCWTAFGASYIKILNGLTGFRKKRLRYGIWCSAEGVIYEQWDDALHLIEASKLPELVRRFCVIDFGYTNPFVCQWWGVDADGRMYLYRQIYHTKRLVEDHARQMKELTGEEVIEAWICDHDAEDRATLEKHLGITTTSAHKSVKDGIQAVQARLKLCGDSKPRLFIVKNSVVERDPELDAKKKPAATEEEIGGYIWDTKKSDKGDDAPVKKDDHGMDDMRYAVAYEDLVDQGDVFGSGSLRGGMGGRLDDDF